MYECLIKNYNRDGSTSYEYWCDEGRPRCPHIPIPEGAEYFICHEGIKYDGYNELYFFKDNFEMMHTVGFSDENSWSNSNWCDDACDRLEYMKEHYGSVVLWKREGNTMNEDKYLLTKLQACEVILSRTSVLQHQSTDDTWVDFKPNANESNAQLYTILFNLDDTKFRIKPEWEHIPIEFCEVMDMLVEGKAIEIFVCENRFTGLHNPFAYFTEYYHDKYSRVVEKQVTYDQWKNSKKGEENV